MLELRPRLKKAADMTVYGAPLVDVGTDHAYLPAYLIINGRVPYAVAGDIGEKPLKNAAQTVKRFGLDSKVNLVVSDGLNDIEIPTGANITVCGMGGTLIRDILDNCRSKVLSANAHLVLQPMTHSEDVRKWLCCNGFKITAENCVRDTGRTYCCIAADKITEPISNPVGYYYFGELRPEVEEEKIFIDAQIARIHTRLDAITAANLYPDERVMLESVVSYYESRYGK